MRSLLVYLSVTFLAACGGGDNIKCGDDTVRTGNTCVGIPGADGGSVTCGAGTQLVAGMCAPIDAPAPGAPTITSITPTHAGVSGHAVFTIVGSGLSDATVFFGDTANSLCQAQLGTVTDTSLSGEVPPACNIAVTVTVTTSLGTATTPFYYDVLFAADGGSVAGNLYVVDPTNSLFVLIGPLLDTDTAAYGLTGLAFGPDGTLYGATTKTTETRELVTVDPLTALVTVIGPLQETDGGTTHTASDLAFSGATLYGWDGDSFELLQIDPATGTVTVIGGDDEYGGLAVSSSGTMYHVQTGGTSDLDTIDPATGDATTVGTLDYPTNAIVDSLKFWGPTLIGVMNDNGAGGGETGEVPAAVAANAGTTLAIIDTTTAAVTSLFEMPSIVGVASHIDAFDVAPATLVLAAPMAGMQWQAPSAPPPATAATATTTCAASTQLAARGKRVALSTFGHGALVATTCTGHKLAISAGETSSYAVVRNHRGRAKLVDTRTGRTILRDVASITAR
ncbi:MAG TPA: IPT/TIG domain-containing protein [Kofleriaceae bacterium]|jgi:hypothetical protein